MPAFSLAKLFKDTRTTSTVLTATLVTLGLFGLVRFSGDPEPEPPRAQAPGFQVAPIEPLEADGDGGAALITAAFDARDSGRSVQLRGVVRRLLPDERESPRRQRLMLELSDGRLLLVSHDVDASERVPVELGDEIELLGRYEWSNRGGFVTGTHRAAQDLGPGGWIRHAGRDYR